MGAPITPSLGRRLGAVEFANIQHTPPKHVACLPPLSNTGLRLHPGFLCGIYFHKSMTFIEILFRFAPTVGRGRRLQSNPMMEIVHRVCLQLIQQTVCHHHCGVWIEHSSGEWEKKHCPKNRWSKGSTHHHDATLLLRYVTDGNQFETFAAE